MRAFIGMSVALLALVLSPGAAWSAGDLDSRIDSGGTELNVRSGPGTDKAVVGALGDGDPVDVLCQVWGEEIAGTSGSTPYWNRIGPGRYVSDAFIRWTPSRPAVPWCGGTADAVGASVTADVLNVRTGPGLSHPVVSTLLNGATPRVACLSWGTKVNSNGAWARVGDGHYVSEEYLAWSPERPWLPWCGQEPPVVTAGSTSGFIAASVGPAQRTMRDYRVPASVSIAQAILESGWGRSTLTRDDHNYFGKKCFGDPGPVGIGCREYATHECSGADCWPTRDDFRAYRNPEDSYVDHGRQLTELTRYAEAMKHTDDPDRFAREIHKAGYATGSTYSDQLIDLMRQYDLYQYDSLP